MIQHIIKDFMVCEQCVFMKYSMIYQMGKGILIMVNMYREWEADRGKEAMETIAKIAEVIEAWEEFKDGGAGYECFSQIRDIMKKDGWI